MSTISIIFTVLFYISLIIFITGTTFKIYQFWHTPAPLKIPIAPSSLTRTTVIMRMVREVVIFQSLFKSNKWTWLFGFLFHFGLLLIFIRHLFYFIPDDSTSFLLLTMPFKYAAFAMMIGLIGLMARRIFIERIRYISAPSDYLMLLIFIIIVSSGMLMTFANYPINIITVKDFASGLISFNWTDLPDKAYFLLHIFLAFTILAIFPISKLLHAPAVFFSPSFNQIDNARNKRHISSWALKSEQKYNNKLIQSSNNDDKK